MWRDIFADPRSDVTIDEEHQQCTSTQYYILSFITIIDIKFLRWDTNKQIINISVYKLVIKRVAQDAFTKYSVDADVSRITVLKIPNNF